MNKENKNIETPAQVVDQRTIKQKIINFVLKSVTYIISSFLILAGLESLNLSPIEGVILLIAGIINLPYFFVKIKDFMNRKFKFNYKPLINILVVFSLFLLGISLTSSAQIEKKRVRAEQYAKIQELEKQKKEEEKKIAEEEKRKQEEEKKIEDEKRKQIEEEEKVKEKELAKQKEKEEKKTGEKDTNNNQFQEENLNKPDLENLVSKVIIKKVGDNFIFENKNNYEIRLRNIFGSFQSNSTWQDGGNTLFSQVKWNDSISRNDGGSVVINANSIKEIPFSDFEYNTNSFWSKANNNKNKPHEFSCLYFTGFVSPFKTINNVYEFNNKDNVFCELPLP